MAANKTYFYFILFFLLSGKLCAQKPISIERISTISLSIAKKKTKNMVLVLAPNDTLSFEVKANRSINFRVLDPANQIIFETIVKNSLLSWEKAIDLAGNYTIEFESVALILPTEVDMTISLKRPQFAYWNISADSLAVAAEANEAILIDGKFQITRANPKIYRYALEKGDTLKFDLKTLSGKSPIVRIKNDLDELVFASLPGKRDLTATIPVLETGTYSISMISNSFFGKSNGLKIVRNIPRKYVEVEKEIEEMDTLITIEPSYDTIPEIFMDTVIFLGAIRDIINPSKRKLSFKFDDDSSIAYWGIFFGAGKEFLAEANSFQPLIEGEALAAGATDILSAYGLGYLKKLPGPGSDRVTFSTSNYIKWNLSPPVKSNYALIKYARDSHFLSFENKSQSVGENVYVKIVLFKKDN